MKKRWFREAARKEEKDEGKKKECAQITKK
jgi:hypothetical protein